MEPYESHTRLKARDWIGAGQHIHVQKKWTPGVNMHWHNYFELEIVAEGTGRHILNGTEYALLPGDAFFLTPTDFHEIKTDDALLIWNVSFDEEMLTPGMLSCLLSADMCRAYRFTDNEFDRLIMAVQLLQHECRTDGPCKKQLCEYLVSCLLRSNPTHFREGHSQAQLDGIRLAVQYLELHFREKISLAQLAAQAGFHPAYFSELFRQYTGETYIERLNSLRISYARMLLANGLSVSDACFASGFGSLSNFLATFKQRCGMTPSAYRTKQQKR